MAHGAGILLFGFASRGLLLFKHVLGLPDHGHGHAGKFCYLDEAARLARKAGFGGVELHGATGYLLAFFLFPHTNRRADEYGGSLENRARFPCRVCRAVRDAVGDYPVGYCFMTREYVKGGLTLEDGAAAAMITSTLRPASLSVTAGQDKWFALLSRGGQKAPAGFMLEEAKAVKAAVPHIAVIAAGYLQIEAIAEQMPAFGSEGVGLGRVLFADTDWLRKIEAGATATVRACSATQDVELRRYGQGAATVRACVQCNPRAVRVILVG